MKSVPMTAYPRTATRRGGVKQLRASGRVPAVIYGRLNAPENLELISRDLETLIHGAVSENILVDLTVVGDSKGQRLALLQEVQHHPLVRNVLHVDLHEVAENETVTVFVPVETTGEPVGVKSGGGTLEHVLFRIKVRSLPKNLPEALVLDVSHLAVGTSIHLGD
ncbi:MAG: 50S ribosomal protein L25, partial [Pedosphaera sp.]|nr:50S ribosomal protein L25 [Pedosphaera sp.]